MDAKEYLKQKAKYNWGLKIIIEKISEDQIVVLHRAMEGYKEN